VTLCVLAALVWPSPAGAAPPEEAASPVAAEVFAGAKWGDSKGHLRRLCPATKRVKGAPDALSWNTEIAGVPATAVFEFGDEGLAGVRVEFTAYHADKSLYVADYRAVASELGEVLGAPLAEEAVWTDDLYRDHSDQWGIALAAGMVVFGRSWSSDVAHVAHSIRGRQLDVIHVLQYSPLPSAPRESGS